MNPTKTSTFKIGDTVSGIYHGVKFVGLLSGYDGSGYLYIDFSESITVYGEKRQGVSIGRDSYEYPTLRLVSRPEVTPAIKMMSESAMGGAVLA